MISVCMLVKNGEKTLKRALDSTLFFPEVLLLDTGSTDQTLAIAQTYPHVRIIQAPFEGGFSALRNSLAQQACFDWIFMLDSDEALSPPLLEEISKLSLNPLYAYSMPRHNFYNQKRIRGCGWSPDRVSRLYHRLHTSYGDEKVHESLKTSKVIPLRSPLFHTPYLSIEQFLSKMQQYSSLFAQEKKGKKSSFGKAFAHGLFAFFRSFILQRGFLDGKEGFIISHYNANVTFYKYLKILDEKNSMTYF